MNPDRSPPRPFSRGDLVAQTGREASAFDARAIQEVGVPQPVLMENAGRSAALVIQRVFRPWRVVGLVGGGNNGGDALVVLRTMAAWGLESTAILVAERDAEDPLLHGWPVSVVRGEDLSDA
ncbi:MAG: NAD(P)H-hydrate epimerase, partial [Longimicrobiales bacterium]